MAKSRQLKATPAAASSPAYDYLPPHNARPGPSHSPNANTNKPLPKVTYRKPPPSSAAAAGGSSSSAFSKPLPPPDPSPVRPRPPRPDSAMSTSTAYSARGAIVHTASRAVPVKKGKVLNVRRGSNREQERSSSSSPPLERPPSDRDSLASLTDDGGQGDAASEYDPDEAVVLQEQPRRRGPPAKLDVARARATTNYDSLPSPQASLNYPSPTEGVGRSTKSNSTLSINVAGMSTSASHGSAGTGKGLPKRASKSATTALPQMPQRSPSTYSGDGSAPQTTGQWASLVEEPDSFETDANLAKLAAWSASTSSQPKQAVEAARPPQPRASQNGAPRSTAYLLNSLLSSQASIEITSSFTQPPFASVEDYEFAKRELKRLQDRLSDKKSRLRTLKRVRGAVGKLAKASSPSRSTSINGINTPLGTLSELPASSSDLSVASTAARSRKPTLTSSHQHSRNLSNVTSFSTTTESLGPGGSSAAFESAAEQVDRIVDEVMVLQDKIDTLKTRMREHVARVLLERCEALESGGHEPEQQQQGDEEATSGASRAELEEATSGASRAELEEVRQRHEETQRTLAELQMSHEQAQSTLSQAQLSLSERDSALAASKRANADLQARLDELERNGRASSARQAKLEADLASSQSQHESLSSTLSSLRSEHDALRGKHDTVTRDFEAARATQGDSSSQAAAAQARYEELELAVSAERKIMAERDALFHAFEARLERAEGTLREQDRRCAALLGKSEGREELDDFLAKIRGGGAKAKEKTAGQDIDALLSSLGQHVEDLADELARRHRDDSYSFNGGATDDYSRADELGELLEQSRSEATRLRAQVEDSRLQIEALNSTLNRPDSTSRVVSARLSTKPMHGRSFSSASSTHQVQELQDRVSVMTRENEELRERLASRSAGSDSSLVKVGGSDDGRSEYDPPPPLPPLVASFEKLLPEGLTQRMDLQAFLTAINQVPATKATPTSSVLLTRLHTLIDLARISTEKAIAAADDAKRNEKDVTAPSALPRSFANTRVGSGQSKAALRSTGLKPIQISKSGFLPYRSLADGTSTPPATAHSNGSSDAPIVPPKSAGSLVPPRSVVPRRSFSAQDAESSPLPSPSHPRHAGAEGGTTAFLTSPSEASSTTQLVSRLRSLESQLHTLRSGKRAAMERCEALEAKVVEMETELEEGRKREVRWLEGMNDASAANASTIVGQGAAPGSNAMTPSTSGQQLAVRGDSPNRSPSPRLFNIALPVLSGWGGAGTSAPN
ncbi:hypothetical protein BDZ90DRAFT_234602 [Jaminaea rosea]|uniref:Uncharacterized protein n=1 Tax=Jaminaea rosea TaxID=1569628 RepID=A0A316UI87_9BASI|nr:hypothetical protein BDZ90DRAFT_234602 [Jaminaea rosea]PWN24996.1 hypothetical protein BDZ90DRAFT_234602 [Jaminaea rosea]